MEETRSQLEPEVALSISDELSRQTQQTFDKVVETDWRLTQHNFLVKAGGAAAILAFWSSNPSSSFAVWPLIMFVLGVIASGLEIRALLQVYGNFHKDALRRRYGFITGKLKVKETVPSPDVESIASKINHWSGVASQVVFVVGVFLGFVGYFSIAP